MAKPPLPSGTYWDKALGRYVSPTDAAWNAATFAALVGDAADEVMAWVQDTVPAPPPTDEDQRR
jgi:hypothetical protein